MTQYSFLYPEVADVISRGWTKGDYARDAEGKPVHFTSPSATCWCLVGAIRAVAMEHRISHIAVRLEVLEYLRHTGRVLRLNSALATWNDDPARTQSEVLSLLNELS